MGLSTSLSNALSGLKTNQTSLDVLSRNVSNSGTPGYHKQSVTVVDYNNTGTSSYARAVSTERAFNKSLQTYYTRQVSDTSSAATQASYLDRFQAALGKPGSVGSFDTLYANLNNAFQAVATSPENYTTRAQAVAAAQSMAQQLNSVSSQIQGMRQEIEGQIAADATSLNAMLGSLSEINGRVVDVGVDDSSRASLLDQRDRVISSVAELIDIKVDYRADGSVALSTRSGVGLLDSKPSVFSFETSGTLSANSTTGNSTQGVGKLILTTPSGLRLDVEQYSVAQGGDLGGLFNLRDNTLVEAQAQLDEIAAGLAQAFSTVQTPGTAVTNGFELSMANVQPGNDFVFTYSQGTGADKNVRVVNTTTPSDYVDASGQRVIGVDLSQTPSQIAAALQGKIPGVSFNGTASGVQVLGNPVGQVTVKSATVRTTATSLQGNGGALNLFVDSNTNGSFTNNLDGANPQKQGFAARITLNPELLTNNNLLVQTEPGGTLGDAQRPNYLLNQLSNLKFASGGGTGSAQFKLSGSLGEVVTQVINYQGATINTALTQADDRQLTLDTVTTQMASEYGVNVDEEMGRLMELQNAYAANARVVSVVKELLDALFAAT